MTHTLAARTLSERVLQCIGAYRSSTLNHPIDFDVAILSSIGSGGLLSQVCEVQAEELFTVSSYSTVSVQRVFMNLRWISPDVPVEFRWGTLKRQARLIPQTRRRDHSTMLVRLRSYRNMQNINGNSWIFLGLGLAPCFASGYGSGRHSGIRNPHTNSSATSGGYVNRVCKSIY